MPETCCTVNKSLYVDLGKCREYAYEKDFKTRSDYVYTEVKLIMLISADHIGVCFYLKRYYFQTYYNIVNGTNLELCDSYNENDFDKIRH